MATPATRGLVAGIGATLWLVGVTVTAPLTGVHPLFVTAQVLIEASPGWLAATAIEIFGQLAQPLLVGSISVGVVAASVALGACPRVYVYSRDHIEIFIGTLLLGTAAAFFTAGVIDPLMLAVTATLAVAPTALFGLLIEKDREDLLGDMTDSYRRRPVLKGIAVALAGTFAIRTTVRATILRGSDGAKETRDLPPMTEKRKRGTTTPTAALHTATSTDKIIQKEKRGEEGQVIVTESEARGTFGFDYAGMPALITPTDAHYVIDKNVANPKTNLESWTLSVGGSAASGGYELEFDDLVGHPESVERPITMVCISNSVGGRLLATGRWRGIPLRSLIDRVAPTDEPMDVITRSLDGYSEALPWEYVREHSEVMLAYGLNGARVPSEHGPPARLLVPGRYGMKSTKWLESVELSSTDHTSYWGARDWDEEAVINMFSYVRAVQRRDHRVAAGGVAFAGLNDVQSVEVSLDGGETWRKAKLEEPIGEYARRRWRSVVERSPGEIDVVTRVIDTTGTVQTSKESPPHPSGSTGWHRITIDI